MGSEYFRLLDVNGKNCDVLQWEIIMLNELV